MPPSDPPPPAERTHDVHTFMSALAGLRDGLWDLDVGADRLRVNTRGCELLGLPPGSLDDAATWNQRICGDDAPEVQRQITEVMVGTAQTLELEMRVRHADGSWRWLLVRGRRLHDDASGPRVAGSLTDISSLKDVEERLRRHAYHDEATGLPNRHLLLERLTRAVDRKKTDGAEFAVVAISVDAFDKVASSADYAACEEMIAVVARRITGHASAIDTLARIRKDRFCLLVEAKPRLTDVLRMTQRIQTAFEAPIELAHGEVFTTTSMGLVSSSGLPHAPEDYLRDVVVALNRATSGGGGQRAVFDLMMHHDAIRRLEVERALRQAIQQDELVVHYQPIVSLETGNVAGYEALLRWQHPERGLLGPNTFIDIAEDAGLLGAIFDQQLPRILQTAERWQAHGRGEPGPFVNVNLSRVQFKDPDLLERLDRSLNDCQLAPRTLGLEVTESVMVADAAVVEKLERLRERNIRLLLDDFGTGYSCLSNLRQFPLDSVKIDKSFIAHVGNDPQSGEIARAIATIAHSLALDVTVEGVENETQLRFAYNLGCEYAQGYYFSKAVPDSAADALLARGYRTSITPPASGKRARKRETIGHALLVDSDHARQRDLALELGEHHIEVIATANGHDASNKAETELPDIILIAADLPGMGCVELCRALKRNNETAKIPVLLLTQGNTSEEMMVECLDLGAADCISREESPRVRLARISTQLAANLAQRKLASMTMTDEQTGVFTRRFLFQALRRSIKSTVRSAPRGLACLVVDADDFKHVNETRGHIQADGMLRAIAHTIDETTRETDIVARFGGAEFVVLLQDTNARGAQRAAEKIRAAVEQRCDTTVSIGGTCLQDATVEQLKHAREVDKLISQLLRDADSAKYTAKSQGKNRVVFDDQPIPQLGS